MLFIIIVFTLYFFALVVTEKISVSFKFLQKKLGNSMEEYVTSKNPQNTADAEYWTIIHKKSNTELRSLSIHFISVI